MHRAVLLAILTACGSKPAAQDQPVGSASGSSAVPPRPPADAWYSPPVLWDAPAPPPPDAPPPPTRPQLGAVLAQTPAIALALDGKTLYALSAVDAIVAAIDLGTGSVTPIDKDPEMRGLPGGILAGPDGLYWDEQKGDDCTIAHADLAKHVKPATVAVAYGAYGPLAEDATQLYIGGRRGLDRLDKKTAQISNIGTTRLGVNALAIDAERVYWIELNAAGDSSILMAKKTGGEPVTVLKSPDIGKAARSLVLDGDTLYWSRGADLVAMPKGGGAVKVLVTSKAIGELAVIGGSFYWVENHEAIATAPKAGGEPKLLGNADFASGLVSDGKTLYWGTPFDVRKLAL